MSALAQKAAEPAVQLALRVRGTVQGVGFRPAVWRIARDCGLSGSVRNDAQGVLIQVSGPAAALAAFRARLIAEAPPLARIDAVEEAALEASIDTGGFSIAESDAGHADTQITPDAAICPACREEVLSPFERRFRYPFTNCTHCGPRLSIIEGVPYDRARTTMAPFVLCADCRVEYRDPADRRFHAQPVACHACGPRAWLERLDGRAVSFDQHSMVDDVDAVASLIQKGEIVAIKGLGGFHLACDATNVEAVARLRQGKRRYGKPFALMARDLDVIRRYCTIDAAAEALLTGAAAPIVLLEATGAERLPEAVAPGTARLGFMLPYTPLHLLIMRRLDRPAVMTSANVSHEPQIIDDAVARGELATIAAYGLFHDRRIANRVDDSVVQTVDGAARLVRRARGYAPAPIALPEGFAEAPDIVAVGGDLKSTFCLVKHGNAILSQHQGDLADPRAFDDFQHNLALIGGLFDHTPERIAADRHPEYRSSRMAHEWAERDRLPLAAIQHHHAHIASCLAENGVPRDAPPVIGVALDGLGYGDDGTIWGGEFLLADYTGYRRLATFKPVAMIGGDQAVRQPWRNTYAHLMAEMGWPRLKMNYGALELVAFLEDKPRAVLDRMMATGTNAPPASSCGRLFDAVAAAIGLAREEALHEGEGAMALEAIVCPQTMASDHEDSFYPFAIPRLKGSGLAYVEPLAMWQALLGDLVLGTPKPVMAARFHKGLAKVIADMVSKVAPMAGTADHPAGTVALSGGCMHNKVLAEALCRQLRARSFTVLTQSRVPSNDGGLSLGQAAIAAASALRRPTGRNEPAAMAGAM